MSDEGRALRKEPWDMTGPELIEALATSVFSGAMMKTAQAREVQTMITAWQDAAASDHAHAQRQAERAEQAEARVAKLEGALDAAAVALSRYATWPNDDIGGLRYHALQDAHVARAALSAPGQPEGPCEATINSGAGVVKCGPRPHRKANQTACGTKQAVGTVLGPSPDARAVQGNGEAQA
jgi:hypothetical protein